MFRPVPQWTEVDGTVAVITELGDLIVGRYSCVSGIALRPAQWSLRIRRLGQCLSDLGELCVLGPRMQSVSVFLVRFGTGIKFVGIVCDV